ncbi:LytTR family DNA-binding domain-containing protein [Sphingomonas echinoides]|uniref:LytTR family DNA-binding domain-containing protein n=1 Tax=Sphingomonas echinoides TaxID=59803 RepID=UPI003D6925F9
MLRNMESVLIHYRFKDAVMDLGDRHGVQVHRSAWVANSGVVGAQRDGRRWSLKLADGTIVPVSETSVALCRARGWLRIH